MSYAQDDIFTRSCGNTPDPQLENSVDWRGSPFNEVSQRSPDRNSKMEKDWVLYVAIWNHLCLSCTSSDIQDQSRLNITVRLLQP